MSISVLVPYYDPQGLARDLLKDCLRSIASQSLLPDEVRLCTSHEIPDVESLSIDSNLGSRLVIQRTNPGSAPMNINQGVLECKSEIIKLLFHDDLLADESQLLVQSRELLQSNRDWLVTGSANFDSNKIFIFGKTNPRISPFMALGRNLIGAPSVSMFYKNSFEKMAENLTFLYDCDWYLRMTHKHGEPAILNQIGSLIRIHQLQSTHEAQKRRVPEAMIVLKRHMLSTNRGVSRLRKVIGCTCI